MKLKRYLLLTAAALLALPGCLTISVKAPDGSIASYRGLTLFGSESVSCASAGNCTATGQDLNSLANVIAPVVAQKLKTGGIQ